jgi:hypothetical protein
LTSREPHYVLVGDLVASMRVIVTGYRLCSVKLKAGVVVAVIIYAGGLHNPTNVRKVVHGFPEYVCG